MEAAALKFSPPISPALLLARHDADGAARYDQRRRAVRHAREAAS